MQFVLRVFLITVFVTLVLGIAGLVNRSALSCAKISPTCDMTLRQLSSAGRNPLIGTAVRADALRNDSMYRYVIAREFNIVTTEDAFKFEQLRPTADGISYEAADEIVNFALANHILVRGHTLVWGVGLPNWLLQSRLTRQQTLNLLKEHIQMVVGRYAGRVQIWDIVNEAIDCDGTLRHTFWYNVIGAEYIAKAFIWAHEADPNALLFYNDFDNDTGCEGTISKSDAIYMLVSGMKADGVPIDGVGIEVHTDVDNPVDSASLRATFARYADIGIQTNITELEVNLATGTGTSEQLLVEQGQIYRDISRSCVNEPSCTALVMWGFTDRYSHLASRVGPTAESLIFDSHFNPKPAYYSLRDVLMQNALRPDIGVDSLHLNG